MLLFYSFDQINAALVSISDFCQKHEIISTPNIWMIVCVNDLIQQPW